MSGFDRDRPGGIRPYPALSRPELRSGGPGSLLGRPKRRGSPVLAVLTWILAALAAVYIVLSGYMAFTLTRPARLEFERSPDQYGLAFESVTFPSRVDAIRLDGWLLPAPGSRRPVVMVHGRASDRQREAAGRALEIAQALVRDGHTVLMFDLRGSGRSDGEQYTLGAEEVRDVGGAIDFLEGRGLASRGVNLLGYSMGAATSVLLAASESRVSAVVADSCYADLGDILEDQVPKASGLPPAFTPGVVLAARVLTGVDVYAIRPVDAARSIGERGTPLLVIHGEADTTVPASHGRRLAAAYGPKAETYFVPGAEHVRSYLADPRAYMSKLTAFLDRTE